ncbi:MAG: hypothetical protein IPO21_16030 [Bacteroidales bacterium]|nr:hypothetical protein [Bacteroidales bacterium]
MEKEDRALFQSVLEIMRKRMKENIKRMEENNNASASILKMESPSIQRTRMVNDISSKNGDLTKENNDLLRMHSDIIKYLNQYVIGSNISTSVAESEGIKITTLTADQLFELTIKGEIPLDDKYPLLANKEFMDKLLEYYRTNEYYEVCSKIVNLIN